MTDAIKMISDINANIEVIKATQAELDSTLKVSVESAGADAKAAISQAENLAKKISDHSEILFEVQQKLAEGVKAGTAAPKTLADIILADEGFSKFRRSGERSFQIEANTIIGQEGSPATNSDTIVAPDRRPGIIPGAFEQLRVIDALPQAVTTSNAIQFTREKLFVNRAAETNEGVLKPESDLKYELITYSVATIPHTIKLSKQVLDDAPALRANVNIRMGYGVNERYDFQALNGDGIEPNMSGILTAGNHTVFNPQVGDNALDSVNRAIEQATVNKYTPNVIMMNTADWHRIERLKVGSSDDRYVVGDPLGVISRVLWGLPVVVTNHMPANTFVVANTMVAHLLYNRQGTTVNMYEQDGDNVRKNLLTIRAERRGLLATQVPAAVQAGNLIATPSGA